MSHVNCHVGVIGASGFVGRRVVEHLLEKGCRVVAWSRSAQASVDERMLWRRLPHDEHAGADRLATESQERAAPSATSSEGRLPQLAFWICVPPIWVLPDYLDWMAACGAQRIVVLSTTSRFTKGDSSDAAEQALARRVAEAEDRLQAWAVQQGIEYLVLRPTLVYGGGGDRNITAIVQVIRRLGVFPLVNEAAGLRQPVHVDDVATTCVEALLSARIANHAYNLSGGETLSYREMVARVFHSLGRRERFLPLPLWSFRLALAVLRLFPRFRHWSIGMAERMNRDLVFDHVDAARDLRYMPRPFELRPEDTGGGLGG